MAKNTAKNAKKVTKIKKTVEQESIEEMEDKISKMEKDREEKCKAAKEQLVEMIKVTADKYRTATGTAEALRVMRFVYGENDASVRDANMLAVKMAVCTQEMAKKAESLDYDKMDQLCDGFYEKDFKVDKDPNWELSIEMMRIDLCRNVGEAAEDMTLFVKKVEDEINSTRAAIKEMQEEK